MKLKHLLKLSTNSGVRNVINLAKSISETRARQCVTCSVVRKRHTSTSSCLSRIKGINTLINPGRTPLGETPQICASLFSTSAVEDNQLDYLHSNDKEVYSTVSKDMMVIKNFLSEEEEASLLKEADNYMKRLRYEFSHWDNAIHGYRETEKGSWNADNSLILERVRSLAFTAEVSPLAYVHVLDIAKEGYIKPHVDAVRFCGDTIAGLCLLSSCVMRLALEKDNARYADVLLPQRCLYIMRGKARYDFTHEVLKDEESEFNGEKIPRDRRISVICRNEPNPEDID